MAMYRFSLTASGQDYSLEQEKPEWAVRYWKRKSSIVSPDGAKINELAGRYVGGSYPGGFYSWSPPGGQAVVVCRRRKGQVYIMSEDGKAVREITSGYYLLPAWSSFVGLADLKYSRSI